MIKVQQTSSPIRRHYKQRLTLIGLGLNRIRRVAEVPDTPQTWGMIARVRHLVRLVDEDSGAEHRITDTMLLKIDFVRDFAEILRQRLMAAGYGPAPGETDEDSITRYLNVLNRTVEPGVRQTKMAAGLTCPPAHAAGMQMLLQKSQSGGDLRPHQSTNIDEANYDDGVLNDWGIHHFHLGTVPYPRAPQFMDRTGPLLYAFVTPDTLYGIAVLEHEEWSNQMLLDEMHKSFPELTAASTLKSDTLKPPRLAVNYSDADVANLRAANINVLTQRPDGTIMVGPGGGVTLNRQRGKKSAKVAKAVIDVVKIIRKVEDATKEKIDEAKIAATVKELDVRLTETAGKLVATDAAAGLRIDIDTQIVKPI